MPNRVRITNVRATMRNAITSRMKFTTYMVTPTGIAQGKDPFSTRRWVPKYTTDPRPAMPPITTFCGSTNAVNPNA